MVESNTHLNRTAHLFPTAPRTHRQLQRVHIRFRDSWTVPTEDGCDDTALPHRRDSWKTEDTRWYRSGPGWMGEDAAFVVEAQGRPPVVHYDIGLSLVGRAALVRRRWLVRVWQRVAGVSGSPWRCGIGCERIPSLQRPGAASSPVSPPFHVRRVLSHDLDHRFHRVGGEHGFQQRPVDAEPSHGEGL